jgi:hypothetical protein
MQLIDIQVENPADGLLSREQALIAARIIDGAVQDPSLKRMFRTALRATFSRCGARARRLPPAVVRARDC